MTEPAELSGRDPRCVDVSPDPRIAEALAEWLTGRGFPAEPRAPAFSAITDGIAGAVPTVPHEFEVWVVKPEDADKARALIAEQKAAVDEMRQRLARRANRTGTVTAVCEECGRSSDWPAAEMGTTQGCPHCGSFMDVPDPDENWDDVDFGTEEEQPGEGTAA